MGKKAELELKAEKEALKKAEKEAKKAAAAARKGARKEAKAAEEDGPAAPELEENNVGEWTDEEQAKLNEGLGTVPSSLEKRERWKAISEIVGSRSMKECAVRFKEVKENLMKRKQAEEEARLTAQAAAGSAASDAAAAAYAAAMEAAKLEFEEADDDAALFDEGKMGALSRADGGAAADKLSDNGVVATYAAGVKPHRNAKDIAVENLSVYMYGASVIEAAELRLSFGNRYGLIGRNGSGKSTLMRVIGARAVPIPDTIDIYHLTTEYPPTEETALEAVMSVDAERQAVELEIEELNNFIAGEVPGIDGESANGNGTAAAAAEEPMDEADKEAAQEECLERLNDLYERLEELDADTAETRATLILKGLGFSLARQGMMTKEFSGGWRMRVALARALFIQPALLLLDEPTNHLDMEAVVWLEDYLSKWTKLLFMVCHSQDFLNNVCTHVVHLDHNFKSLSYYKGNYDQFVETRQEAMTEQLKRYTAEQEDIKSMKEYVARFGHGTATNARQAKSKQKLLDKKLNSGLTEKPVEEKLMQFKFPDPSFLPPPVLQVNSLTFGYPGQANLYEGVDFGLDLDARIALVGPNGAGKSTLVKVINGELVPRGGSVRPHGHLKMAKFTQHFEDVLDLAKTPLQWFMDLYPELSRDDARKWLGRYGTSGGPQMQGMAQLSEGQKAKVVFAKMAKENAHLLLLDEPTNALDMEMIDSLALALKTFKGGVLLVSHDMRLISQVANEIWIVDKGLHKFKGDIMNFKMDLRKTMTADQKETQAAAEARRDALKASKKSGGAAAGGGGGGGQTLSVVKNSAFITEGIASVSAAAAAAEPAAAQPTHSSGGGGGGGGGAGMPLPTRLAALAVSPPPAANTATPRPQPPKPQPAGSGGGSYVPPHLRHKQNQQQGQPQKAKPAPAVYSPPTDAW